MWYQEYSTSDENGGSVIKATGRIIDHTGKLICTVVDQEDVEVIRKAQILWEVFQELQKSPDVPLSIRRKLDRANRDSSEKTCCCPKNGISAGCIYHGVGSNVTTSRERYPAPVVISNYRSDK